MRALRFLPALLLVTVAGCDSTGGGTTPPGETPVEDITITYGVSVGGDPFSPEFRYVDASGEVVTVTDVRLFPEAFSFTVPGTTTTTFFAEVTGFFDDGDRVSVSASAIGDDLSEIDRQFASDIAVGPRDEIVLRVELDLSSATTD